MTAIVHWNISLLHSWHIFFCADNKLQFFYPEKPLNITKWLCRRKKLVPRKKMKVIWQACWKIAAETDFGKVWGLFCVIRKKTFKNSTNKLFNNVFIGFGIVEWTLNKICAIFKLNIFWMEIILHEIFMYKLSNIVKSKYFPLSHSINTSPNYIASIGLFQFNFRWLKNMPQARPRSLTSFELNKFWSELDPSHSSGVCWCRASD